VEDDVPGVDCADVCAHERECGTAVAADCDAACRCSVDEVFAPAFVDAYYGCRLATSCGVLGDDTCVEEVDDFPASDRADRFIAACTSRCAGIPCEYFKIYRDDVLDSIEPCLDGGDCVACFDQAAMGCP
jgi:hypothetical protein